MATDIQTPEQELESLTGVPSPNQTKPVSTEPDHEKEFESLTGAQAKPSPKSWIDWLGEHVPHYKLTPQQRVDLGPKPGTDLEHLGEMVPQAAVPALAAAKKYAVDPFNTLTEKGAKATSELAEGFSAAEPASPNSLTPPPKVEDTPQLIERYRTEHPIESGVARGAGSVVGGMVADPRNWPFFGASAARPLLQRLLTAGFASQMSVGATKEVKELIKDWPDLTPTERSERMTTGVISTAMAALATTHAITSEMGTIAENNMHKSPEDMLAAIKKKQAAGKGAELTPDELRIQDLDARANNKDNAATGSLQPPPAVASGETLTPPPQAAVAQPEPAQPAVKALPGKVPSPETLAEAGFPGTVPDNVRMLPPKDIVASPQEFQFRAGLSESGLGDITNYDPKLAGILSVWKNPADEKVYVVNGHHRLDLANRAGAPEVLVRYLDAVDSKDARAQGALINIADGNATAIDAAKFFRDTGLTADALAQRNVSLGNKKVADGVALANLSDGIFDRVIQGDVPQGRGVVIGRELPNMADQSAILQLIDSQGKKGVRLTDDEVRDMARFVKSKESTTSTEATLFGDQFVEESNAVPWVQLSSWVRKTLARDKQLFGFVAKSERARELARAGNIIDVEKSGAVAGQAKVAGEVYDKLLNRAGPVSKALDEGAARIARGEDVQKVRAETYANINGAVSEALGGTEGQVRQPTETGPAGAEPAASGGTATAEVIPMGEMRLRDALKSHPTIGPAADDLLDSMGVVTQNAIGKSLDEFLRDNWADVRFEGVPGEPSLKQQTGFSETLAWARRQGALSIEPHGEQLDLFGNPEKVYMLTNKNGDQAMVLESELNKMAEQVPSIAKKWDFMQQTGGSVELPPEGEAPTTPPPEQVGLFGNIKRGVEDEEGSLFAPPPDDSILFQEQNPVWYSKASNILADPKLANAQSGPQWFAFLKNQGVKADEFKWTGLDDFLRDKKKVTKQEVQDFIRENQVGVTEVVKNQPAFPDRPTYDGAGDLVRNADGIKYSQYTLPGDKSNYTELLMTLPEKPTPIKKIDGSIKNYGTESRPIWTVVNDKGEMLGQYGTDRGRAENHLQQLSAGIPQPSQAGNFRSGHFDEPNILAHVRFDDRVDADGKRMLFLEEVQSDWHQKGKKIGYADKDFDSPQAKEARMAAWKDMVEKLKKDDLGGHGNTNAAYWDARHVTEGQPGNEYSRDTLDAVKHYTELTKKAEGVPDAPFKTDWHEMAMKRMIRWAAEHGYDKVGWVTGDQTAARYDLSKHIDSIFYVKHPDGSYEVDAVKDGSRVFGKRLDEGELADNVGKDVAQRIVAGEGQVKQSQSTTDVQGVTKVNWERKVLTGVDLKVGGEWANNLYDKAIPNFLQKYGKKWGAKVGDAVLDQGENPWADAGWEYMTDEDRAAIQKEEPRIETKVHSMDVTPEMKRSVMEGQPLFQEKKGATEFMNDGKAIVYLFKNADASTFLHEFVHTLEPYLKAEDRGILDKWLDESGFEGARDRKEALARAFEDFHYDNEAPTPEIKGIFQRIQEIMRQIYESIKDSPLVKPSAEVNDLFKKWYGFADEAKAESDLFQMMKDVEPTPPMEIPEPKEEVKPVKEELPPPPAIKVESLKPPPGDATLQSVVIPGLKEFYEQDVEPTVREMGTGLIGALEAIRDTVAPRYGVPTEALDELMRLKGDRDKQLFLMEQTLHGLKKMFDRMPQQENLDFIDRYKTGEVQKTGDLQAIADFYKKVDQGTYNALKEYKPSLTYKENHFRVFWKTLPMGEEAFNQGQIFPEANTSPKSGIARFFSRKPLQGTKGFMKASTLDDISTGIERGGIPVSYNPQTLFELGQADAMKFITAQRMFNNVRQIPGMAEFIKMGERIPEGFSEINDKIAKVYFKPASGEGFIEGGKWVFESGTARALNNFLSRDLIRENFAGKGLMYAKNFTTALELSISPFHFVFETIEAMGTQFGIGAMRSWNLGVRDLNPGQFVKGLVEMGTSPYAPIEAARLGGSVLKYVRAEALEKNPELRALTGKGGWLRELSKAEDFMNMAGGEKFMKQYPDAPRMIGDLFPGGAKLAIHEDFRISTASTFLENINSGNYIGAAVRALPALNEKVMAPLFDHYIPRLKVGTWLKEYSEQLLEYKDAIDQGKMTRTQLARDVWDRMENRFGEMNFDNLFWNRTFKSTMQLAFRSVTWKLGNLRAATQAIGGQLSNFADPLKMLSDTVQGRGEFEGKRLVPKLDPNMAWILGVGATTAVLGTITAKMMTGKTPWEWVDEDEKNGMSLAGAILIETTHPRIGGYDDHGKPNRVSLPTYFRDYEHLMSSPARYVKGSVSSLWTKIPEVWSNKDFYGEQVFNPDDPMWQKVADGLGHLVDMPFAFSNFQSTIASGGNQNAAILGFLGFTKAPREVDMSAAEKVASDIIQKRMDGLPGRNEQQQAHSESRREIIHMMRHNDPEAYGKMLNYLQGGKLQHKDVGIIEKAVHESWLQSMVGGSNMDARHAMDVWKDADRTERGLLMNIMILKIRRSQSLSATEKQEYINQILNDSKGSLPPPPGHRNTLQAPPQVNP